MTAAVPTTEPTELTAGRTWKWTRDIADYPAGTWTLTYYFKKDDFNFQIVATAVGTTFSITAAATTTAPWKPGRYIWKAIVTAGGESYEVDAGELVVQVDFATSGNFDARTHARRTLEAIEATLEKRATADQLALTVGNRSLSRAPIEELIKMRDRYRQEAKAEERADKIKNGIATNNSLRVRF